MYHYRRPSSIYFKWTGALQDPHSFPTRRSSDLAESGMSGSTVLIVDDEQTLARSAKAFLADHGYEAEVAASGEKARSEEHTSELQSRLHLVCRLLLEKKNST